MPQVDDEHRALIAQLVAARRALGVPQRVVAGRMGVVQSMVGDLECCHHDVTLGTLQRYARAVGCRVTVEREEVAADVAG